MHKNMLVYVWELPLLLLQRVRIFPRGDPGLLLLHRETAALRPGPWLQLSMSWPIHCSNSKELGTFRDSLFREGVVQSQMLAVTQPSFL